jgi:ABC-type multidrug transport system fused ATPase/permease subunit
VPTGELEFHGVSFEYSPGTVVLSNLNFRAEGGKTLALVGETGSGKSTILRLIFRFYNPASEPSPLCVLLLIPFR